MNENGHDCVDVKWYRDCPICRIDTLIAERDKLRERVKYLEAERVQLVAIDKSKTELVRELKAEVQHRTEWGNHYRAEFVEAEAQLTMAKRALGEITDRLSLVRYLNPPHEQDELLANTQIFIAKALTQLDGKDHHCWAAPDNIDHCGHCGRKFEGEGAKHPTARPQPLE